MRSYKILFLVIIPEIMASLVRNYCDPHPPTDYCAVTTCENPRAHTFCVYEKDTIGVGCKGLEVLSNELTANDKEFILRTHNELRAFIASGKEDRGSPGPQPAALNMQTLIWDDTLASMAQTWANQCPNNSNPYDQCRDVVKFKVEQNFAQIDLPFGTMNLKQLIEKWYEEVVSFDSSVVHDYRYEAHSRNYAQLVWATTITVGCGRMTTYNPNASFEDGFSHVLVCNYGPKGINEGYPVYQAANPETIQQY